MLNARSTVLVVKQRSTRWVGRNRVIRIVRTRQCLPTPGGVLWNRFSHRMKVRKTILYEVEGYAGGEGEGNLHKGVG